MMLTQCHLVVSKSRTIKALNSASLGLDSISKLFDEEGNQWSGEVPYNSKVRVKYKVGNEHPVHGVATYLEAVKVLEVADAVESPDRAEF